MIVFKEILLLTILARERRMEIGQRASERICICEGEGSIIITLEGLIFGNMYG